MKTKVHTIHLLLGALIFALSSFDAYAQTKIVIGYSSLSSNQAAIWNEPDLAERILKAMVGANAFILEPKNKEEIKSVLAKYLRLGGPAEAEEHYQSALKVFSKKPFVDSKGISSMIEFMGETDPAVARLKPEAVINHALLKKLDEAGFFESKQ